MASSRSFYMPAETDRHAGTMMAWPTEASIVGEVYEYAEGDVPETRRELANLAKTIAKYEPLHMFVRDPKFEDGTSLKTARKLLGDAKNVTIHVTPNVHSLWARDSGPIFVRSRQGPINNTWGKDDDPGVGFSTMNTSSETVGMLLNFNNWGRKNLPNPDAYLAAAATQILEHSSVRAPFIAEGGAIEVDGEGTLLATESSILNPNRNPGIDKETMERYFAETLGIEKTIWIKGNRGFDITDDHIDCLARFASPGVVLLSKAYPAGRGALEDYESAKAVLRNATDAKGRKLKIIDVPESDPKKVLGKEYDPESGPTVSYVNYLVVNGAVVMAKFGDERKDAEAARIIGEQYPGRVIEQVYLHQIAVQGGGIHCSTQQIVA